MVTSVSKMQSSSGITVLGPSPRLCMSQALLYNTGKHPSLIKWTHPPTDDAALAFSYPKRK